MAKTKRKSTAQVSLGGESVSKPPQKPVVLQNPGRELTFTEILKARWHLILTFFVIVFGSTYAFAIFEMTPPAQPWQYEVVAEFPHDPKAFTQGLLYHDGFLYESTGRYGESSIRKVDIKTGDVLINKRLPDNQFGEGLVKVGDRLLQLTWKENRIFEYDLDLNQTSSRVIDTEGWGLTYDGKQLIVTSGWNQLKFYNTETLELEKKISITQGASRIDKINEMEMVDGKIVANRLNYDFIYIIDPKTGKIEGKADLSKLFTGPDRPKGVDEGVLNGIAYNPEKGTFYVTGKNWPKLFEIRLFKQKS